MSVNVTELRRAIFTCDLRRLNSALETVDASSASIGLYSLLGFACENADGNVALALIKAGCEVNGQAGPLSASPLIIASGRGKADIVTILLEQGADITATDANGIDALGYALLDRSLSHDAVVRSLIEAGAIVEGEPWKGITYLMAAARSGTPAMVSTLIDAGANVNAATEQGSALTAAVLANRTDNVETLLDRGADKTQVVLSTDVTIDGKSAETIAREVGNPDIANMMAPTDASATQEFYDVEACWNEIEVLTSSHAANINASLWDGASVAEINELARILGVDLSEDFRTSLSRHNGQDYGSPLIPTFGEFCRDCRLMSVDEIQKEWAMMSELLASGDFDGLPVGPDAGVQPDVWNVGWVPFATNGAGDFLCVDCAPAVLGESGKIITFYHESGVREICASSYKIWMNDLVDSLKRRFRVDKST